MIINNYKEVKKDTFWNFVNKIEEKVSDLHHCDYIYPGGSVYSIVDGVTEIARIVREACDSETFFIVINEN